MKKPKLSALGKALEAIMNDEAVSWYRLSMLSGVNQGTLSKIKWQEASPTLYTLNRLAKALNVKLSDIILKAESIEANNG